MLDLDIIVFYNVWGIKDEYNGFDAQDKCVSILSDLGENINEDVDNPSPFESNKGDGD